MLNLYHLLHTENEDEWEKEVSAMEEFSINSGDKAKPLHSVGFVVGSHGEGLCGTWALLE